MRNADDTRFVELKRALKRLPRVRLATLPTPLERLPGLTRELGGPELWVKRDDLTGLATGGNKTRMFEYVLARVMAEGVDTVVAGAAVQSNYCRQLAAACAKLGLECHLILRKVRGDRDDEIQGGLLLDLLVGAKVEIVEGIDWVAHGALIRERGKALEARGKKVYVGRTGDESGLGEYACAYANAFVEMVEQAEALDLTIDELWMSSSDSTQAGLAIGAKHVGSTVRVVGLPALPAPIAPGWTFPSSIASIGNDCAKILGLPTRLEHQEITSIVDYVGPGYGIVTDAGKAAMRLVGRSDGLLLDPVYTSKAMAGLIDHVRRGRIPAGRSVVFLHTGGMPALFAYGPSLGLEEAM
jgi:D-cysteine desulfhydrase family pyridoxal phosphate-dependent enzyme